MSIRARKSPPSRPSTAQGDIAALPGLGPKTASWLGEVGITDVPELRRLGAVEAYRRLKHWDPKRVSRNALWGLYAALNNMRWTEIPTAVKTRLLREAGE
jgi:DNA transformation protein